MKVVEQRAQEKNAPLTVLHAKDISKLEGVEIGKISAFTIKTETHYIV